MTFLAGIRTRVSVGTRPYHVLTFTRTVSRNKYIPLRHEADYCMDLGRAVGADSDDLDVELFLTNEEKERTREALHRMGWNPEQPLAAVFPETGGSAPGWAVGRWAEFVARILEERKDLFVLVDVVPGREQVRATFQSIDSPRLLLSPGTSDLREVMAMIAASTVVVSASTGPMHMAAALKIPTVTQFCPLPACSPQLWGPKGNRAKIVLPPDDYCREKCPGDPHECSFEGGIGEEEMLSAVVEILDELASQGRDKMDRAEKSGNEERIERC
ncbi:MAG: glycosyltransferase family 9 protein [Chlorobi bacterium]|nr:glycosyltransferase family 9 protein [Chlorobiota bacterium]